MNARPEAPVSEPVDDLETDSLLGEFEEGKRLVGTRCDDCGRSMIGSRIVCSNCVSRSVSRIALPQTGVLYSFTRIHVGSEEVRLLGYVDLDDVGVRTLTELIERDIALQPDVSVELVVRGDDWYFAPTNGN